MIHDQMEMPGGTGTQRTNNDSTPIDKPDPANGRRRHVRENIDQIAKSRETGRSPGNNSTSSTLVVANDWRSRKRPIDWEAVGPGSVSEHNGTSMKTSDPVEAARAFASAAPVVATTSSSEQQFLEQTPWANPNHPIHRLGRQAARSPLPDSVETSQQPVFIGESVKQIQARQTSGDIAVPGYTNIKLAEQDFNDPGNGSYKRCDRCQRDKQRCTAGTDWFDNGGRCERCARRGYECTSRDDIPHHGSQGRVPASRPVGSNTAAPLYARIYPGAHAQSPPVASPRSVEKAPNKLIRIHQPDPWEAFTNISKKKRKCGPKVRFDTISQDRSGDCEKAILLYALRVDRVVPPADNAKNIAHTSSLKEDSLHGDADEDGPAMAPGPRRRRPALLTQEERISIEKARLRRTVAARNFPAYKKAGTYIPGGDWTDDRPRSSLLSSPEECPMTVKTCRDPSCPEHGVVQALPPTQTWVYTHPFKCQVPRCKYLGVGFSTEIQLNRHMNDKHGDAPTLYACDYDGCEFKSKRESNLKQHKEKTHGWTYIRNPGVHKGSAMTNAKTIHHANKVSLEDSHKGKISKLAPQKSVICGTCNGRGGKEGAVKKCMSCDGAGVKTMMRQMGPMIQRFQTACPECLGEGEIIRDRDKCKNCHGEKTVVERRVLMDPEPDRSFFDQDPSLQGHSRSQDYLRRSGRSSDLPLDNGNLEEIYARLRSMEELASPRPADDKIRERLARLRRMEAIELNSPGHEEREAYARRLRREAQA